MKIEASLTVTIDAEADFCGSTDVDVIGGKYIRDCIFHVYDRDDAYCELFHKELSCRNYRTFRCGNCVRAFGKGE